VIARILEQWLQINKALSEKFEGIKEAYKNY
jgi:hypothetical protein